MNDKLLITHITAAWLREENACEDQVLTFEAEWPNGADITAGNIRRAIELKLDVDWLFALVLRAPIYKQYQEARAAIDKQYDEALAPIDKQYREALAPIDKQYREALAEWFIENVLGEPE